MAQNQIEPLRPREIVAFFISALIVPGFWLPLFVGEAFDPDVFFFAFFFVSIFGVGGIFALGVPAYQFLIARNLTAFWIAPIVGGLIGMLVWLAFHFLFGLFLGVSIETSAESLMKPDQLREFVWPAGGQGVIVGVVLWLIARPDRINRDRKPDNEPIAPAAG